MGDVLQRIVEAKAEEVAARKAARSLDELLAATPDTSPLDFTAALAEGGLSAIAEIKRRSPSKGPIRPDAVAPAIARDYQRNGASAISVLTDREFFGGSDEDLIAVRAAVEVPLLRKDFTIDAYQIHEARALGADAVLLIASVLTDTRLPEWIALSAELGLSALVEVHDADELGRAVDCGARIIGINARNLRTFETDLGLTVKLRPSIPAGIVTVAESGMHTPADLETVRAAGFDACLIGEALMRAPEPGERLATLLGGEG